MAATILLWNLPQKLVWKLHWLIEINAATGLATTSGL